MGVQWSMVFSEYCRSLKEVLYWHPSCSMHACLLCIHTIHHCRICFFFDMSMPSSFSLFISRGKIGPFDVIRKRLHSVVHKLSWWLKLKELQVMIQNIFYIFHSVATFCSKPKWLSCGRATRCLSPAHRIRICLRAARDLSQLELAWIPPKYISIRILPLNKNTYCESKPLDRTKSATIDATGRVHCAVSNLYALFH